MSVTEAAGFRAAGVDAGLITGARADLALLVADQPAVASGVFTRNAFPAAPVALSRRHLADGRARAVVVNAGQANAGTGEDGLGDAAAVAEAAAHLLGASADEILVCSTGLIGPRIPVDRIRGALPRAVEALSGDGGGEFARAILTTDAGPKECVVERGGLVVGGCVKGAGMVAPDLATMLAFLTIDARVDAKVLDDVVRRSVAPVFNGLTIDACTSTNDTVLVFASGAGEVTAGPGTPGLDALESALAEAAENLAHKVAEGAEGATRSLVVRVEGAASDDDARRLGRAVAGSLLVKTAIFGGDPNIGRLLQAIGASGAAFDGRDVTVWLGREAVIAGGRIAALDEDAARAALKERQVVVRVSAGNGTGRATSLGCDLGYDYVRLNSEYST
ncbi:MAG: bifunctional glutamate N-acetyltransferase/amino-acid acetyltransferase ArgJ [Actinomycetota bacterium]